MPRNSLKGLRRATGKKEPASFKPFKAKDYPHRDYRGEKIVSGQKVRV